MIKILKYGLIKASNKIRLSNSYFRMSIKSALMLHMYVSQFHAQGSNLSISNIKLINNDIVDTRYKSTDFRLVQFDISWQNSWRDNINWDAVWIFVKYKVERDEWKHATLNYVDGNATNDGHKQPKGAVLTTPPDGKGIFIYRSEITDHMSSVNFDKILLRWNSGTDDIPNGANLDIQVFGIEMVYVPKEAFAVGSGGSEFKGFKLTTITTGDATVAPKGNGGILGSPRGGYPAGQISPQNPSWPNGFNAFYCMKYEISQGQYANFLNTLSANQAKNRYANRRSARYTIRESNEVFFASAANRACNFLSWSDGAAFADWAALRPLTELEYEKACRGPKDPVKNEYAWGSANIHKLVYKLINEDSIKERIEIIENVIGGNAAYNETNGYKGPYRCGIFMLDSEDYSREQTGASYYRIMGTEWKPVGAYNRNQSSQGSKIYRRAWRW